METVNVQCLAVLLCLRQDRKFALRIVTAEEGYELAPLSSILAVEEAGMSTLASLGATFPQAGQLSFLIPGEQVTNATNWFLTRRERETAPEHAAQSAFRGILDSEDFGQVGFRFMGFKLFETPNTTFFTEVSALSAPKSIWQKLTAAAAGPVPQLKFVFMGEVARLQTSAEERMHPVTEALIGPHARR